MQLSLATELIRLAGLILSGNTLYGTASAGGTNPYGTVFAVNTNGSSFTTLHAFTGYAGLSDGGLPCAGLILSGNTLYGTTPAEALSEGTVFSISLGSATVPQPKPQ